MLLAIVTIARAKLMRLYVRLLACCAARTFGCENHEIFEFPESANKSAILRSFRTESRGARAKDGAAFGHAAAAGLTHGYP